MSTTVERRAVAPKRLIFREVLPIIPGEVRRRVARDARGVPYGIDMQTGQMVRLQGKNSREAQRRAAREAAVGERTPTRRELKRQRRAAERAAQ